ncbi:MAG: hypothetical protein EHM48_03240, partial [Planctomycetaceae bacterium]
MKHITLAAMLCAFAFAAVELVVAKDEPATKPGVTKPANMPLEAKLILTKDTYTLDTALADKVKA